MFYKELRLNLGTRFGSAFLRKLLRDSCFFTVVVHHTCIKVSADGQGIQKKLCARISNLPILENYLNVYLMNMNKGI